MSLSPERVPQQDALAAIVDYPIHLDRRNQAMEIDDHSRREDR